MSGYPLIGHVPSNARTLRIAANLLVFGLFYQSHQMRKPYPLISSAWLLHAVAWFLPVETDGVTFPHGLPGWQAFRVAASAVWPYDDFHADTWYYATLSTISALTTPLFIFGSAWVVLNGTHVMRRTSAWIATFAFIVNAHWYVLSGRKDLKIGYFLWWLSFLLVAVGLFALSPQTVDNASIPSAKPKVAGLFE